MSRPVLRAAIPRSLRDAPVRSLSAAALHERVTTAGHDVSLDAVEDACESLIIAGQVDVDPRVASRGYRLTPSA